MGWNKNTDKEKLRQYYKDYYNRVRKHKDKQKRQELLEEKVCPICGTTFKPERKNQKYCCDTCRVTGSKLQSALYRQTQEYKDKIKAYRQTPEYKAKEKERRQTEEYKEYRRQYIKTGTYKEIAKRYMQSEKGKAMLKRYQEKRKANGGKPLGTGHED